MLYWKKFMHELSEKAVAAESKIARAAADPNIQLSEQEKKQYMSDIIKHRTVEAMMRQEASPENFPEFKQQQEDRNLRMQAASLPPQKRKGVQPLDKDLGSFMTELET